VDQVGRERRFYQVDQVVREHRFYQVGQVGRELRFYLEDLADQGLHSKQLDVKVLVLLEE
jgi:hypothetical protein